jgi:hypothetical protein
MTGDERGRLERWRLVSIPGDEEQDGSRLREAEQTRGGNDFASEPKAD